LGDIEIPIPCCHNVIVGKWHVRDSSWTDEANGDGGVSCRDLATLPQHDVGFPHLVTSMLFVSDNFTTIWTDGRTFLHIYGSSRAKGV